MTLGKTKGKGTFGKVKQGSHNPTNEKVIIIQLQVAPAFLLLSLAFLLLSTRVLVAGGNKNLREGEDQGPR